MAKIKTSETIEVKRSEINFADYNPRKKSDKVVESLKKNIKKVGLFGGIVWNQDTGNIVSGHKRIEALDQINKYDGTPETDYTVKVEKVSLDDKTEKEQNIYMNNPAAQGEYDYKKLAFMLPDISIEAVELTDIQIEKIKVFAPGIKAPLPIPEPEPEKERTPASPEKVQELKDLKKNIRENYYDRHDDIDNSVLTIVFSNWDEKVTLCEMLGIDIEAKMISGIELMKKLEN